MGKIKVISSLFICVVLIISCNQTNSESHIKKQGNSSVLQKESTISTPSGALNELMAGNERFQAMKLLNTEYKQQIENTKGGQKPHSVILSCMDSRVPPEIIFDQGIGNLFVIRVAGNVEDLNVLGSMEYAVEHAGSKLIVVMGHSHCGAVTGAVKKVNMGNLTQLLDQIKPAIIPEEDESKEIEETAKNNVRLTIKDILSGSEIINEFVKENKIAVVGAYYNIETGEVTFLDSSMGN
jgi:carbonic anhydrase